jgi:hypothetical protein
MAAGATALAILAGGGQARAQQPGDSEVRVAVLTFSPSSHPFLAFGHNALWIHDPRLHGDDVDLVYNFGTFAFGSPWVIVDFVRGRLTYWLSVAPLAWTLEAYAAEGRGVRAQQIALSQAEADQLERVLLEAARPENREYPYGYTGDNCATRLRDALDRTTGGALHAAIDRAAGPGRLTYRAEIARVLGDTPLLAAIIDAGLGPAVDRPMSPWEAAFLPDRFARGERADAARGPPVVP